MKEEQEPCSSNKLPPKMGGGGSLISSGGTTTNSTLLSIISAGNYHYTSSVSSGTPSKHQQNDEILSTLLRMNNFDSISSIKDESLDIDLSACVTITGDPSGIIGGNSLSSSDFWRVLDESAQTPQLDLSNGGVMGNSNSCSNGNKEALQSSPTAVIKKELNDFSGTFLKPDAPTVTGSITFSPLKRIIKPLQAEQHNQVQTKEKSLTLKAQHRSEGPPSLSPILRIPLPLLKQQQQELYKVNNSKKNSAIVEQKKIVSSSQPPPLAVLETSVASAATKELNKPLPDPIYKCVDCDNVVFHDPQELAKHTSHRLIYKCPECEKEFEAEAPLKRHLKTHRSLDGRKDAWKKCPDCGKCLKLGSMWMHRKIHTENKKYGCDICGQKFVQKINLTHHQRIHTSEKPYECSECQKRFQERSHLQRHQKYHAQTRSYRCEKCGKMYKTERCLKVHNLVHLEQRPFACTVCDKSFISNSKLKQHSNIHTGERPFKCNYCPRDFTNFPNWLKHTRRRHKVDHKTGEMLENIPSYCSKKSTRTPKEKKVTPAVVVAQTQQQLTGQLHVNAVSKNNQIATNLNLKDLKAFVNNNKEILVSTATPTAMSNKSVTTSALSSNINTLTQQQQVNINGNGPPPLAKVPTKRKKKLPTPAYSDAKTQSISVINTTKIQGSNQNNAAGAVNLPTSNGPPPLALVFNTKQLNATTTITTTSLVPTSNTQPQQQLKSASITIKPEKSKRERKQPMPKQVQQVPHPLIIKKEFIEPANEVTEMHKGRQEHHQAIQQQISQAKAPFPDLHCLSITSAEELIMEQALEMEECGLYKASAQSDDMHMQNFADTDNAISSETMADLHFKIKEEHDMELKLKTEDYDTIKKSMCSSLESSPFSSPASMEFAPSSTLTSLSSDFPNANNFYLPPFSITNNQIVSNTNSSSNNFNRLHSLDLMPQLITTNVTVPELLQLQNQRLLKTTTASSSSAAANTSFINQLYLPLTVNGNQALPSVDTLLFSHSKLSLINSRNSLPKPATTAQHNLT